MSDPVAGNVLDAQVQALLQRVETSTGQRCAQAQAAADSQTREILRSARAEALASVRKAVAQERARLELGLRQAQAQADILVREQAQQKIKKLLERMWQELPGQLESRWHDPAQRRVWIEAALDQAGSLLRGRPWRIEHGDSWSAAELPELEALARSKGASAVEWADDPALGAGLNIRADGVCLAATVTGLLARQADIESAFLAQYFGSEHDATTTESPPAQEVKTDQ